MEILDQLKFDEKGLITAVVQDIDTNQILMVAYMNREAVKKTIVGNLACFWRVVSIFIHISFTGR